MRSIPSSSPSQPLVWASSRRAMRSVLISSRRPIVQGPPGAGAAGAGVFVFAGGGVGPPAVAEFDFALIEVLFEFGPFRGGRGPVFPGGPRGATAGEVGLVVADDVFLEDGHVAVRRLHVQVPKESCTDVDRQAVVDEVGGKQAAEVVRGKPASGQLGVLNCQGIAEFAEFCAQRSGMDNLGALPDRALEQKRLRLTRDALVRIKAGRQRHAAPVPGEAADGRACVTCSANTRKLCCRQLRSLPRPSPTTPGPPSSPPTPN
ncbi:hypothetical protein AHiyo6_12660 [Arthrobacter sp. Hiyo6]|nr:hypothetical protein AHiyo6_12660 [Arthrobacter sp. Hiyo6]